MAIRGRVAGVRVAGGLLAAVLVAGCAVAYMSFVASQRQYLSGRNFRLLGNLARQFDNSVQAEARVIASLAGDDEVAALRGRPGDPRPAISRRWAVLREQRYQPSDIVFEDVPRTLTQPSSDYDFESRPFFRMVVSLWSTDGSQAVPLARLRMDRVLDTIFKPRIAQGAFDTIVLADASGEILYATGRRARELQSSGLTGFGAPGAEPAAGAPRASPDAAKAATVADITVAGVDYTLFFQPCCRPSGDGGQRLLLGGLVPSDQFRSATWAISTTVVKLAVLALLIAVVAWPFLRVALIGDRQKIRVSDFFQLGAASVAGLAIITIALLDISAYWHMNADTDAQLEQLAGAIDRHATEEVTRAQAQLTCLEERIGPRSTWALVGSSLAESGLVCAAPPPGSAATQAHGVAAAAVPPQANGASWPYPFFETVALIDQFGAQRIKLATTASVPSPINVAERPYFKAAASGRGWQHRAMCPPPGGCTLESVWSWTTGEPVAVLARPGRPPFAAAAISIPMRSLIRPVLPPGFEFAVIDAQGQVLFHSDRQRNVSENLFEETDDNRRLRAQVAAHSAEPVNIRYWGAAYRAYVKPMELPGTYVVAMAQKQRSWAINREWLVVSLIFLIGYLLLWLVVALATLLRDSSWLWPDPARRTGYERVALLCASLIGVAALAAWGYDRNTMVVLGGAVPLAAWCGTYALLRRRPSTMPSSPSEPVAVYSAAAILLMVALGVVPGTLLFLASYQLHGRSYIRNSQLLIARALSERRDRLYLDYSDARGKGREALRELVGHGDEPDLYVRFRYGTVVQHPPAAGSVAGHPALSGPAGTAEDDGNALEGHSHNSDTILSFLEDYLPYYSEASVEWRELLHDHADDGTWLSEMQPDGTLALTVPDGSFPVSLTSMVPALTGPPAAAAGDAVPAGAPAQRRFLWADWLVMGAFGLTLVAAAAAALRVLLKQIFLVGVTQPLWTTLRLAANAGDNVFVLCDERTKARQVEGATPVQLGPIARDPDSQAAWRRALIALDRSNQAGGAVLVDDFDDDLEDTAIMETKLALLEELVADPARTVVVLSRISASGLRDSLRRSAQVAAAGTGSSPRDAAPSTASAATPAERWRSLLKSFVVVEWREFETQMTRPTAEPLIPDVVPDDAAAAAARPAKVARSWTSGIAAMRMRQLEELLETEGGSHPYVRRVCDEIRRSDAVRGGVFTREQAFEEIAERTTQCYRAIWASCSDDEKVVLGHVAEHGLANASVRGVVRRLLGRRLLRKAPALCLMNQTFRSFVLSKACWPQVAALETADGPSTWDRLRMPLAVGVVGAAVFLFTTQKELYNAILGVTTAAAVSVPALVRAVGMLAGRQTADGDHSKT